MTRNKQIGVMFDEETLKDLDWECYKESKNRGKSVSRSLRMFELFKEYLEGRGEE